PVGFIGVGGWSQLPRGDPRRLDGTVAWNGDDVDRQADRARWDTETRAERDGQSNRLEEQRGRRSGGRVPAFASQQPGESRDVGLFDVGFGDTHAFIRPNHVDDALLPVESDAALRERQPRKRPHLRLPTVRWAINRNADADDAPFRTAPSSPP